MPIFETQRVWRIEAFEADNRSWLFFFGRTAHPPACNGLLIYVPKLRRGQRRTVQPTHTTALPALALLISARPTICSILSGSRSRAPYPAAGFISSSVASKLTCVRFLAAEGPRLQLSAIISGPISNRVFSNS